MPPVYRTMTQCLAPSTDSIPVRSATQDPWIGRRLRDYVIEGFVGAGGMGRVYRARHEWLEMPVAIKIINESLVDDEATIARFRREALAVARLHHPNIIRATDGGTEGQCFFLVTELIDGENLANLVRRYGQLSVADACAIICQAAAALQHAHENGMVHRDVKPSNLMISKVGDVKLLDLGLARFSNHGATLTETGQVMGTLDFMAPEQAGDTRRVDIRADIYSLGCTLYCLLTGMPPFAGPEYETAISKMLAHSEVDPAPVSQFRTNVPTAVIQCLNKMMAKERNDRFNIPSEVAVALAPFAKKAQLELLCDPNAPVKPARIDEANLSIFPRFMAAFDHVCEVIVDAIWLVLRFVLWQVGILQRNVIPAARTGQQPKVSYGLSAKGLMNLLFLGGVLFFIFYVMGLRIYYNPPPSTGPQQPQPALCNGF